MAKKQSWKVHELNRFQYSGDGKTANSSVLGKPDISGNEVDWNATTRAESEVYIRRWNDTDSVYGMNGPSWNKSSLSLNLNTTSLTEHKDSSRWSLSNSSWLMDGIGSQDERRSMNEWLFDGNKTTNEWLTMDGGNRSVSEFTADGNSTSSPRAWNESESEYDYDYEAALGTFFWGELVPPLLIYSLTYILGVTGNSLIIFTICRFRRLRTTTNVFLASLASADLLLLIICIPVKLARLFSYTWSLGAVLCKTLYYLQALSAICSVLTLTTMSIERFYAIVYPMRAQYRCTISQAKRLCAGVWVLSLVLASPTLLLQVHMEVGEKMPAYWCVRDWEREQLWQCYETFMLVLVLLVPASVMAIAYTAICAAVITTVSQRRAITGKGQMSNGTLVLDNLNKETRGRKRDGEDSEVRQVVSMLVVVVVLFVLCWSPILILNVLKAYGILPAFSQTIKHVATAADLLSYCNSCINPIVYGFMSRNFRESFKQVCCGQRRPRHHHPSSVTRQPSLSLTRISVTRISVLRYNTDSSRIWKSRGISSRHSYPLSYAYNAGRGSTGEGSNTIKTTPS